MIYEKIWMETTQRDLEQLDFGDDYVRLDNKDIAFLYLPKDYALKIDGFFRSALLIAAHKDLGGIVAKLNFSLCTPSILYTNLHKEFCTFKERVFEQIQNDVDIPNSNPHELFYSLFLHEIDYSNKDVTLNTKVINRNDLRFIQNLNGFGSRDISKQESDNAIEREVNKLIECFYETEIKTTHILCNKRFKYTGPDVIYLNGKVCVDEVPFLIPMAQSFHNC